MSPYNRSSINNTMFRKHIYRTMHPCVSLFFLCNIVYVQAFQCARTKDEWNKASGSLQCQEPNYYHCLRDENGILTQQCLQRVWIQNGMCPEFNSRVGRIDVFKCQSDEIGCPNTIFWSNAVYIYPTCYDKTISTTTAIFLTSTEAQLPGNATSSGDKNNENPNVGVIVAIVISIAIVIIAIIVGGFMCVRRKKKKEKENENSLSFKNISEVEISDGMATNVSARANQSDQSSEINEEEKLLGKTNKNISPRGNQIRQPDQFRMIKEQENLIGRTPKHEIPGHNQPHQLDYKRENAELIDLNTKFKNEVYGPHILIFALRNATLLNENTMKYEAFKRLNVKVDMENSFRTWASNKEKKNYVFQDWISSDGRYDENGLRKTQLEILQAVEKNKTKFVVVIPFEIWSQNAILKEMESWHICQKITK